jgi:hypothetical protein
LVEMKALERLGERRRRKAHQRYLEERERQERLSGQDAEEAVRTAAQGSGTAQQGMYGHGT